MKLEDLLPILIIIFIGRIILNILKWTFRIIMWPIWYLISLAIK